MFGNRILRRNHALEHATIVVMMEREPGRKLNGFSTDEGFFVQGVRSTQEVESAAREALRRLRGGEKAVVGVVLASGGYPGAYRTGLPITGLDALDPDVLVFHAGTRPENGVPVTAGGRVLTVVAEGQTLAEARARVYDNIPRIRFEGMHYR